MSTFHVRPIQTNGQLHPAKSLFVDAERLGADEVVATADEMHKIPRPKLTLSLGLSIRETGHDVAIVGECSTWTDIPKQIWVFSECANVVVNEEEMQLIIRILKQDYEHHPLTRYFE